MVGDGTSSDSLSAIFRIQVYEFVEISKDKSLSDQHLDHHWIRSIYVRICSDLTKPNPGRLPRATPTPIWTAPTPTRWSCLGPMSHTQASCFGWLPKGNFHVTHAGGVILEFRSGSRGTSMLLFRVAVLRSSDDPVLARAAGAIVGEGLPQQRQGPVRAPRLRSNRTASSADDQQLMDG